MKRSSLILVLLFPFLLAAQTKSEIGKIALAVVIPENIENLDGSQLSKLQSKVTQIVTKAGFAASGYTQNFVIYPDFAIYETEVVEGGLQNITIIHSEMTLVVKQITNDIIFATTSFSLKGSGSSKKVAITNAIANMPVTDPNLKAFIETAKAKIVRYYQENCNDIQLKAEVFAKNQNYEAALGTLMSVPEEVSACYNQVISRSIEIYKAYQNQKCAEQIQQAKVYLAANDYIGALAIIGEIDPSSICYADAESIAKSAADNVDEEAKRQWDFKMKQYDNAVALEKQRIDAIKEIAVSYYSNQPKTVVNTIILR